MELWPSLREGKTNRDLFFFDAHDTLMLYFLNSSGYHPGTVAHAAAIETQNQRVLRGISILCQMLLNRHQFISVVVVYDFPIRN